MQVYFPSIKTKQGAIGLFDYLVASRDSINDNVIFNSDLNLDECSQRPGGTGPIEKYELKNNNNLYSFLGYVIQNFENHNSQVFQDLYVSWKLKNKQQGVFFEVGTCFPTGQNNTWILESKLNWSGVLVEPNPEYHTLIKNERKSPLEPYAIHNESGVELTLRIPNNFSPGGGIDENFENKFGNDLSDEITKVVVNTISITDCLKKYQIPVNFDYLSFDTTGNDNDVHTIQSMLQNKYFPKIITIGHNYKSFRPKMHNLLISHGYIREFDYLSKWDDWYYHKSLDND